MPATRFLVSLFSVGLMVLVTSGVSGQNYPSKVVRVVTSTPGGSNDFAARLLAQGLTGPLGQQVIVDNRAGSVIPGDVVSKAPPDGHTLLIGGGTFTILQLLQETPYDPVTDFAPISLLGIAPLILVVHSSMPVKSIKELIALAKAQPRELNYAASVGGTSQLSTELFKSMTGASIAFIPYKGGSEALADLLSGRVHMTIDGTQLLPHVKLGKLRALGVTSARPSALFPGMPTIAASGVPDYEAVTIYGLFAPAKTPAAIITRLNQEVVRVLNQADSKEKFLSAGIETVGSSPEEHAAKFKSEIAKWAKIIKDANIQVK